VRGVAPDGDNASPFGAMATSIAASYTPQNAYRWRNCATRRAAIHGIRSGTDHVEHEARLREHGDMAGVDLIGGRAHPLRHEALEVRLDRAVLVGHDVPTGFDFQAVPSTFSLNSSAAGAAWVAQTRFRTKNMINFKYIDPSFHARQSRRTGRRGLGGSQRVLLVQDISRGGCDSNFKPVALL
jgi:hypothetical protein